MRMRSVRSLGKPHAPTLPAIAFLIVYAVLLLCVPSQLIFAPLGAPGTPANMWGIFGLLWWVCATLGGLNPVRGITPTRVAAAALTAAVLASYANGMADGWYAPPSVRQSTDELWTLVSQSVPEVTAAMVKAADRGLLSFAGWMGVVLVAAEGLRSWRDVERLVDWLTWLGAFVATLGIIQFFTGLDIAGLFVIPGLTPNADFGGVVSRSVLNRVSSTAVHPIEFGVVLAGLFPLALHRTLRPGRSRRNLVPTVLIFTGAFMSVSRSAVLALFVIFIVLFLGWPARRRIRALQLAPLAIVALRVGIPGLVGTIVALFTNLNNDPSVSGRTQDYGVVFAVYGEHPLLGRGLFTFVPRYYRILDNQYLTSLIELGAIGLAILVVFLGTGYFCARSAFHHARTVQSRHLGLVLSASMLGQTLSMFTFDEWGFPMAAGLTFLTGGIAGAVWRLAYQEDPNRPGVRGAETPRPAELENA